MKQNKMKELVTLSKNKFLSLYQAIYENKLGEEKSWFIASRKPESTLKEIYFNDRQDEADAVLIVAIHETTQKLVLVKQYRVPINDYIYELPAGLIDQGEDFRISVARELKEETGLTLISIDGEKSHQKLYLSPGMTDESVHMIYCTCSGKVSTEHLEADEDIEPLLISREEAKVLVESNIKMDIKAYIILQNFAKGYL